MRDRVYTIISNVMDIEMEEIADELAFSSIPGWDSLKHINMVLALEEDLDIHFDEDEIVGMLRVGDVMEVVNKYAHA